MVSTSAFETARPHLTAVAFRLLGSIHDAEDAVQSTWIKASATDERQVRDPIAWLTTLVSRVCIDMLRVRTRRSEEPLLADTLPAHVVAADEAYLQRETVSRAVMVLLGRLTADQRVAYVLHDLFGVPFREVAESLDTSPDNAKQLASRARRRIEGADSVPSAVTDDAVVDAFLAAAAGGDIDRMVSLMSDDCVRVVEPGLVAPGTPVRVAGARAIAEETKLFADRITASAPMLVDGRSARVIAPGGHLLAVIAVTVTDGRVTRIEIGRLAANALCALRFPAAGPGPG